MTPAIETGFPVVSMESVPSESAIPDVIETSAAPENTALSPAPGVPVDGDQFAESFQFPAAPPPVQVYDPACAQKKSAHIVDETTATLPLVVICVLSFEVLGCTPPRPCLASNIQCAYHIIDTPTFQDGNAVWY